MIYLFLGKDTQAKDKKIEQIKTKFLKNKEALNFDYDLLYGDKLKSEDLKKSLIALPAVASKRVVIVRFIHKLSPHNKDIILKFIESKESEVVLILDSDQPSIKNSFITKVTKVAEVFNASKGYRENAFDMTKQMQARNPAGALKILSQLLASGDHPLQIMGALVWFWGRAKQRLSPQQFKAGLLMLKDADLSIKRSRLRPEYTLEVLVVKLCSLIA